MGDGHDGGAFVRADLQHRVVGHAGEQGRLGRVPVAVELLARVAYRDVEIERGGHAGEHLGGLVGADDQQPPARPVHAAKDASVEIRAVGRTGGRHRAGAIVQVHRALDQAMAANRFQHEIQPLRIAQRFADQAQRAAARQAEARGLVAGDAVGQARGSVRERAFARGASGRPRYSRRTPSRPCGRRRARPAWRPPGGAPSPRSALPSPGARGGQRPPSRGHVAIRPDPERSSASRRQGRGAAPAYIHYTDDHVECP